MKILITGAAGFIGSNLAEYLHKKHHDLILVDNLEYGYLDNFSSKELKQKVIIEDIRNLLSKSVIEGVEVIYHLAGISSLPECQADPKKAIEVNVIGTANLLELARKSNVKNFIFASTSAVYENNTETPFSEEMDTDPDLVYSQSKKMSEDLIKSYCLNYNIKAIICRFFNVYGPNQDFRRKNPPFTSYIVRESLNSEELKLFNTKNIKRDYIFISDLLEVLEKYLSFENELNYSIHNLCSGHNYSPMEIISKLSDLTGKKLRIVEGSEMEFWAQYPALLGDSGISLHRIKKEIMKQSIGSNKQIKKLFNKTRFMTMDEGLQEIIDYQKNV